MKKILIVLTVVLFTACGNKIKFGENSDSISKAKETLVDKFGADAYYTNIIINDTEQGSILNVTVTEKPSSLKMEEWNYFQGSWKQKSDITLELAKGTKAEDFMFKLDKSIVNFELLGKLVEESKEKVAKEKNMEVVTELITINAPDNGDLENMSYFISTKPESGGTKFTFRYKMDGKLDKFDY